MGIETDLKFSLAYKSNKRQRFLFYFFKQAEVLLQRRTQTSEGPNATVYATLQSAVKSRAGKFLTSSSGFPPEMV